jgi:small-conductance mechanosensitive channel
VTDRIKEVFQEEGIEIPYPKRDIYIKKEAS